MRLAVASTSFPLSRDDGSGRFVQTSVEALVDAGARVSVHVPDDLGLQTRPGLYPLRYMPRRGWQRLCYRHGVLPNLRRSPFTALAIPGLMAAMTRRLRTLRDRPVIAHWLLPTALAASLARHPCFISVAHGSDVALLERLPGGHRLAQKIAATAAGLCFASLDLRARFERLCGHALPHAAWLAAAVKACEPFPRDKARRELELPLGRPVALFMGRLLPGKGVASLLRIAARLGDEVHFVVAGDGPLRSEVERVARGQPNLRTLGPVPPSRQAQLFAAADLLLVPSRPDRHGHSEGLPAVILEALASGLPVLSCPVGGIADLLRDGRDARLCPPDDIEALRRALLDVARDPALAKRLAAAGRQTVKPFLAPAHARRLLDLIRASEQRRLA